MSDYEEEEIYPVGMQRSFSSSFDSQWVRTSTSDDDCLPMKRSLSELNRGECMNLETVENDAVDMLSVNRHSDLSDIFDDSHRELPKSNENYLGDWKVSENGNCPAELNVSNTSSSNSLKSGSVQNASAFYESFLEKSTGSAKRFTPGVHNLAYSGESSGFGFLNIDYSRLQHIKRLVPEHQAECSDSQSEQFAVGRIKKSAVVNPEPVVSSSHVSHRTVADIRNNIPSVDTAGCYAGSISSSDSIPSLTSFAGLHVELSQMKKRSPGVAKRLEATTPSRGDFASDFSKNFELSAIQDVNDQDIDLIDGGLHDGDSFLKSIASLKPSYMEVDSGCDVEQYDNSVVERPQLIDLTQASIGKLRQAITPSNDLIRVCQLSTVPDFNEELNTLMEKKVEGDNENLSKGSIGEAVFSAPMEIDAVQNPEHLCDTTNEQISGSDLNSTTVNTSRTEEVRSKVDPFYSSDVLHNAILFDSFDDFASEDQTFTLSPDETDWESDDAYSELEEEGRISVNSVKPSSMPSVEDGLSGSDTDDHVNSKKKKHKRDGILDSVFSAVGKSGLSESEVAEFFSGTRTTSDCTAEGLHEDNVEKAIRDIYRAMERNKASSSLNSTKKGVSPFSNDGISHVENESVWVVRSSDSSVLAELHEDTQEMNRSCHSAQLDSSRNVEQPSEFDDNENGLCKPKIPLPAVMPTDVTSQTSRDRDNPLQKYFDLFPSGRSAYAALQAEDCEATVTESVVPAPVRHANSRSRELSDSKLTLATVRLRNVDSVAPVGDERSSYLRDLEAGKHPGLGTARLTECNGQSMPDCPLDGAVGIVEQYFQSPVIGYSFNSSHDQRWHHSASAASEMIIYAQDPADYNTDDETDELLDRQYSLNEKESTADASLDEVTGQVKKSQPREALLPDSDNHTVLIEGVLFRTRYLGSTKIMSGGNPSKAKRMMQAQEAVGQIKTPDDDSQPSTEVDLFISAEKIMVLDTGHREVIMDHALQTISYIADIGDLLVIMVRLAIKVAPSPSISLDHGENDPDEERRRRRVTICCHVFESDEAQLIAQSIGQAFQVAYAEFLKANGIEDPNLLKDVDYQEVLNQQQIFGEELSLFSSNDKQKEVRLVKQKGEILGIVLVESGWGSMLPTVVLANLMPSGPAARTGRLNIGDQIMSIDGNSLVGLPLSACQNFVKATRHQTVVKLKLVSCAPVVEVLIKRPHVKYQLGFSVQNGVICSLLRGGIGERGGVRVGHRIIEINGLSMVAVPHERIVHLLATSVGEIHMKTMQTSIFRLLTGQDIPHYI